MTDERAPERYFEDYAPGSVFDGGTLTLSADEIIDFARKYDPQAFHIDPVAAENGPCARRASRSSITARRLR